MKILIIDEEFPYPLNTGKRIRSFNLARVLARTHEVSYLAYGFPDTDVVNFMRDNHLSPVVVKPKDKRQSGIGFYLRLFMNLFSPYPYIVTSHYSKRFINKLLELLECNNFDCLICEWTPYAIYLKDISNIKKIIAAHNIESSIWRGYEAETRNPLQKLYIKIQRKRVERFERQCFHWSDGASAVSREEADAIKRLEVNYPVEVIDNGVDLEYYQPQNLNVDEKMMVFTASMDWRPNQDAARYFINDILPLIKLRIPEAKTFIIGRNPSQEIRALGKNNGVTVTGTVNDVRPYTARAALCIVPLRIGGGSRLKILEAMAMQKAVVSTTRGAEGLRTIDGVNIMIGDNPGSFAEAVVTCLNDVSLRERIACEGRAVVEKYYRWEELGENYRRYIESIVR